MKDFDTLMSRSNTLLENRGASANVSNQTFLKGIDAIQGIRAGVAGMSKEQVLDKHKDELMGFIKPYDDGDAPDGAWFAMLEEGGREFIKLHKLKGVDGNDVAHYYIQNHPDAVEVGSHKG